MISWSLGKMNSAAWLPWKAPTAESFWTGMHWAYRIPVFLLFLSFVAATAFWPGALARIIHEAICDDRKLRGC